MGGAVKSDSSASSTGVIVKINANGKVVVQSPTENKRVNLQTLLPWREFAFRLDKFTRNEDAIRVTTTLFGLVAQDFKIDKDKWKMLAENSDNISMALLRQQQQRLAVIKAIKVFFSHHNTLRQILRQKVTLSANSMETINVGNEDGLIGGDMLDNGDTFLLQRLLVKATQPSPIKATFSIEEMEFAALAVSQYLAAVSAVKKGQQVTVPLVEETTVRKVNVSGEEGGRPSGKNDTNF